MPTWLWRLAELVRRGSREERLSSEIEHHIELLTDELKQRGLSDADARWRRAGNSAASIESGWCTGSSEDGR